MTKIVDLKNQLSGLSVGIALHVMKQRFGARGKTFVFDGIIYTVNRALRALTEDQKAMPCGDFGPLSFAGGPPGQMKWHKGSMLSMLCDLILFEEYADDMSEEARWSA